MSEILASEVRSLGFLVKTIEPMGISLNGSIEDTWYLNLHLRTANKVLWEIESFKARDADELYQEAKKIKWDDYFTYYKKFSIESFVKNTSIKDTRYANLRLKDAIADYFSEKKGKRPDSGKDRSEIVIFLHWVDHKASVSFNTSGETIAKHGYKEFTVEAPLIESLASGIILSTNWDQKSTLVNPMCGSGTIAIEGALIALNRAPGHFRENFSFMHLESFIPRRWKEMKSEARKMERTSLPFEIIATDHNEDAVEAAKNNARLAGVGHLIKFSTRDFRETKIPKEKGVVIINPEYGERLGNIKELEETYKEIGDFFKQKCEGYTGYVFTGNLDLAKLVGLKSNKRIEFFNGKIDCRLIEYDLYSGKKE